MISTAQARLTFYAGCLLTAAAYGLFFTMPLYLKSHGADESVAGTLIFYGAISTLAVVANMNRLLKNYPSHILMVIGAALYAIGSILFASVAVHSSFLSLAGVLQGAGWGMVFTLAPIILSNLIEDHQRSFYFSVLTAFYAIGMGGAPIISQWLLQAGVSHAWILMAAGWLTILAALAFFHSGRLLKPIAPHPDAHVKVRTFLKQLLRSEAVFPLVMVALGACIFSSMMNFQATFAASRGLDFSAFYGGYSITVIAARFFVSNQIGKRDPHHMMLLLLGLLCLALFLFPHVTGNVFYFFVASALGFSYGLAYPVVQAHAVNVSARNIRDDVLVYFSLSYFVGIYGFPIIAGHIIAHSDYNALFAALLAIAIVKFLVALCCYYVSCRKAMG